MKKHLKTFFILFIFVICVTGIFSSLYLQYRGSRPLYFDAPIQDSDDIEYDENNALNILRKMNDAGLDLDD